MFYTSHEYANIFPMMSREEHAGLVDNMRAHGYQSKHPITLYNGKILDGRNRYQAALDAGVDPQFENFAGTDEEAYQFVISENEQRRHLQQAQKPFVAAAKLDVEKALAKKRMESGLNQYSSPSQSFDKGEKGRAAEKAAQSSDTNRQYTHEAEKIAKSAPDLKVAVMAGKFNSFNEVRKVAALPEPQRAAVLERVEAGEKANSAILSVKHESIVASAPKELNGKYRVIYADPPWKYGDTRAGLDGYTAAADHYPSMSIQELRELPIKSMAEDNAVLFLWVTSPLLEECFEMIKSWGFRYKSSFIWDKIKHNVGHYNSVRHELLLICTRGSCTPDVKKLHDSVQSIERSDKHSEKPEEFRLIIDEIYPHGKRIELFRRGNAPDGWDVWGNQADV